MICKLVSISASLDIQEKIADLSSNAVDEASLQHRDTITTHFIELDNEGNPVYDTFSALKWTLKTLKLPHNSPLIPIKNTILSLLAPPYALLQSADRNTFLSLFQSEDSLKLRQISNLIKTLKQYVPAIQKIKSSHYTVKLLTLIEQAILFYEAFQCQYKASTEAEKSTLSTAKTAIFWPTLGHVFMNPEIDRKKLEFRYRGEHNYQLTSKEDLVGSHQVLNCANNVFFAKVMDIPDPEYSCVAPSLPAYEAIYRHVSGFFDPSSASVATELMIGEKWNPANGKFTLFGVLTSKTESGDSLLKKLEKDPDLIEKIDIESFASHCLTSMLLRVNDGHANNFLLNSNGKIVAFDNDVCLFKTPFYTPRNSENIYPLDRVIFYCFKPLMEKPLPNNIVKRIRDTHHDEFLLDCFSNLQNVTKQYASEQALEDPKIKDAMNSWNLPAKFHDDVILQLKQRFIKMKNATRTGVTIQEIFEAVLPIQAKCYGEHLSTVSPHPRGSDILEIFEKIYNFQAPLSSSDAATLHPEECTQTNYIDALQFENGADIFLTELSDCIHQIQLASTFTDASEQSQNRYLMLLRQSKPSALIFRGIEVLTHDTLKDLISGYSNKDTLTDVWIENCPNLTSISSVLLKKPNAKIIIINSGIQDPDIGTKGKRHQVEQYASLEDVALIDAWLSINIDTAPEFLSRDRSNARFKAQVRSQHIPNYLWKNPLLKLDGERLIYEGNLVTQPILDIAKRTPPQGTIASAMERIIGIHFKLMQKLNLTSSSLDDATNTEVKALLQQFLRHFPALPPRKSQRILFSVLIHFQQMGVKITKDEFSDLFFGVFSKLEIDILDVGYLHIEDKMLTLIASQCRGLKGIRLQGNELVTGQCFAEIAQLCPNLEILDLRHCKNMVHFDGLAHMKSLKQLFIHGIGAKSLINQCPSKLSSRSLKTILNECKQITHLDLFLCPNINDDALYPVTNSSYLKHLKVSHCIDVSDLLIYAIMAGQAPQLQELWVMQNGRISQKAIDEFKSSSVFRKTGLSERDRFQYEITPGTKPIL